MSKHLRKSHRKPRRKKAKIKVSASDEKSFGSILDEAGFQPSGKRILISKVRGNMAHQDGRRTPVPPAVVQTPLIDDRKVAQDVLSDPDRDAIRGEVNRAMRRWSQVRRRD